jgi:hypothetical protein
MPTKDLKKEKSHPKFFGMTPCVALKDITVRAITHDIVGALWDY